jgi:hypothetical protein
MLFGVVGKSRVIHQIVMEPIPPGSNRLARQMADMRFLLTVNWIVTLSSHLL